MSKFLALHEPVLGGNEHEYLKECIDTGWVSTGGKFVSAFEDEFKKLTGTKYAVACTSGTASIHLALKALRIEKGTEIIVPTITFAATINAVHYVNAVPIFMDCDAIGNIDVTKTIEFIIKNTTFDGEVSRNRSTGREIRALIPVHIFGTAVWLDDLVPLCEERNIQIIEDAAESLGTRFSTGLFSGQHTGSVGKAGCFSFNGNKIITTGGGGMLVTDDERLASYARYLSTQAKDDPLVFRHDEVGFNYRLTNLQAAVGMAQLEQLPEILSKKEKIHLTYCRLFGEAGVPGLVQEPAHSASNHWLNRISIRDDDGNARDTYIEIAKSSGVELRPVWLPNHQQRPNLPAQAYKIEEAFELVQRTLCLPSSAFLEEQDLFRVVECFRG